MGVLDYVDDDTDPDWSDFELKIKMMYCFIFTTKLYAAWTFHQAICNVTHHQAMYR